MDASTIEQKNKERLEKLEQFRENILQECFKNCSFFITKRIQEDLKKYPLDSELTYNLQDRIDKECKIFYKNNPFTKTTLEKLSETYLDFSFKFFDWNREYGTIYRRNWNRYADSPKFEYHGDILITDPCYFISDEDWDKLFADYDFYSQTCPILMTFNKLPSLHMRDTIWGDWDCTVTDQNGNKLGEFGADVGMVAVVLLDELKKYNPQYEPNGHRDTIIKDFHGTIQYIVHEDEQYDDYFLEVYGEGTYDGGKKVIFTNYRNNN